MDEKLIEQLRAAGIQAENLSAAQKTLIDTLTKLNRAQNTQTTASDKVTKELDHLQKSSGKTAETLGGMTRTMFTFISSFTAVIDGMHQAKGAFTAVIPTLELVSKTISNLGTGILSIVPWFGEAAGKALGAGMDLITNILTTNLRAAQRVADSFTSLSKTGVNFGGSLKEMTVAAGMSGLTIENFSKFVIDNIEAISNFGGAVGQTASSVARLGHNIGSTNKSLLAQYGSYEALADGITQYIALQRKLGNDEDFRNKEMQQGAEEFLIRQRELAAITGKTAATLVKEENERRNNLAYQLKAARLGSEQQANLNETINIFGKIGGPAAQKYLTEFFATGGKIYTAESIKFRAGNEQMAMMAERALMGIEGSRKDFRNNITGIIQEGYPGLVSFYEGMETLAEINLRVKNQFLDLQTSTGASVISQKGFVKGIDELFKDIQQNRLAAPLDKMSTDFATFISRLNENQRKIDTMVVSQISSMGTMVDNLYTINEKIILLIAAALRTFNELQNNSSDAANIIKRFGEEVAATLGFSKPKDTQGETEEDRKLRENVAKAVREIQQPVNATGATRSLMDLETGLEQYARGGIVTKPSIAGEAGPEAVVPLPDGRTIPTNIDLTPLTSAMNVQNALMQEVLDELKDSKDIQERIMRNSA